MSLSEATNLSPFEGALNRADLSRAEFARRMRVSDAAVSRWCSGTRMPSVASCVLLAGQAGPALLARHRVWFRERRKQPPSPPSIKIALPEGIEPAEARQLCDAAIGRALEGAK